MMKTNFGLCNVKDFHIIHGALWDSKTHLVVKQVGSEWAITVSEGEGDNKIETFTITEIMEKNKIDVVDILKLDIEGSEKQLFNNNPEVFLKRTKFIAIEVHEKYISKDRVNNILKDNYFETFESGELIIGKNLKLVG